MSKWSLQDALANVRKLDMKPLISYDIQVDLKNNSLQYISLNQGELMFEKDMYAGKKSSTIQEAFVSYFKTVVGLLGGSKSKAETVADQIWNLEKKLAEMQSSVDEGNDVEKNYRKSTVDEVQKEMGDWIDLEKLLVDFFGQEIQRSETVLYNAPKYYANVQKVIISTPKETLADYVVWKVVYSYAQYLPLMFSEAKLSLWEVVDGTNSLPPSWETCVKETANIFKYVTSALFVQEHFPVKVKKNVKNMLKDIVQEFRSSINYTEWLPKDVKTKVIEKLDAMGRKVGYPQMIRNITQLDKTYSDIEVKGDDYFGNILNATRSMTTSEISRLGNPPRDIEYWGEAARVHEIAGYYEITSSQIIFPAASLLRPYYDPHQPMALNFGAAGSLMGHEIIHAFDNKGVRFDKDGNMDNWWNPESLQFFNSKTQCMSKQYDQYAVHGHYVDGLKTLPENIADNGGTRASFNAYRTWLTKYGDKGNEAMSYLPGLKMSEEQLFFLGFTHSFCSYTTPEGMKRQLTEEDHPPAKFRVIGTLSNMDEFSEAYGCPENSPMNPAKKCRVW